MVCDIQLGDESGFSVLERHAGRSHAIVMYSSHDHPTYHRAAFDGGMAATLGIGPRTVDSHLRSLFDRLGVQSRTELVIRAIRDGWIRPRSTATTGRSGDPIRCTRPGSGSGARPLPAG